MSAATSSVRKLAHAVIAITGMAVLAPAAWASDDNAERSSRSQRAKCLRTAPVVFNGDIVAAAVATPSLSTLVALLQKANLVGALSGPGPFTVFAPTNEAFAKIPAAVLAPIGANVNVLSSVLTYHVSSEHADPRVPRNPDDVTTLQGQTLFLQSPKGVPMINQSTTSCQAVKTTNGTVWIIDSVLLPQFR